MSHSIPLFHSLKFKVNLVAFLIFLMIIGMLVHKSHQDREEIIQSHEAAMNQIAVDTVDRRFKVSYEILETGLSQVLANTAIAEAFALRDREQLAGLVLPSYEKLTDVGITHFHFHLPNAVSFFRAHAPEEYGDDLSGFRETVVSLNQDPELRPIKGLEEGTAGLSLRYLAPIHYHEHYVGSVELGMEVGPRILNIFSNVSGGEWYLYSFDEASNRVIHSTVPDDLYPLDMTPTLTASLQSGQVFQRFQSPYVIQLIPLSDYAGNHRFYLKRVFDNSQFIEQQRASTQSSFLYALGVASAGSLVLWLLLYYLLRPLMYLEQKTRKFEAGTLGETIEVNTRDEIGYLASAMENMRQSLLQREEKLKAISFQDPLTGMHNRHYLETMLQALDQQQSYPITILIADLDDLKEINDTAGHPAGDAHIITCAQIMKRALRQTDFLCRVGGDEFALLLPKTDETVAKKILNRINEEISAYNHQLPKNQSKVSISLGIATCQGNCSSLEEVMALADQRMYLNKQQRKSNKANNLGGAISTV